MRVYKISTYVNESELTRLIMDELKDVVDGFIFLEASHTYQMNIRPEYPSFPFSGDNIHHIKFESYPENAKDMPADKVEELVTSVYIDELKKIGIRPNDVLLYGDSDELPNSELVKYLAPQVKTGDIFAPEMIFCNYWINCISYEKIWTHFKIFNFQTMIDIGGSPQENIRKKIAGNRIPNGGWHYSWFGGKSAIINKLESYSHSEFNLPKYKDENHIDRCLQTGNDIFNRGSGTILPIDEIPLPTTIINNIEKYKHWITPSERIRL